MVAISLLQDTYNWLTMWLQATLEILENLLAIIYNFPMRP